MLIYDVYQYNFTPVEVKLEIYRKILHGAEKITTNFCEARKCYHMNAEILYLTVSCFAQ